MVTTQETGQLDNAAPQGAPQWRLFVQMEEEVTTRSASMGRGVLSLVSPAGKIHTFDFTSGGGGKGMLSGLDADLTQAGDGMQATYELDYNSYAVNSTNLPSTMKSSDGRGSWLRLVSDPTQTDRGGTWSDSSGFFGIHDDGSREGTAGCVGLDEQDSDRFFGLMEDIRRTDPSALPTHLTVLGSQDASKKLKESLAYAHNSGARNGERELDDEVTEEMLAMAPFESTGRGRDKFISMPPEEILAFIASQSEAELKAGGYWISHDAGGFGRQTIRNLQTTDLQNYYPQAGTEGLSGRAAQIAADGKLGEVTHHAIKLSQDTDGSFAKSHIEDSLRADHWGDSGLLKLDASLNRQAEVTGNSQVAAVNGVFTAEDQERISQFISEWRAEHGGETFELGSAAVKHMIRSGMDTASLSELTGMEVEAIETAQIAYGSAVIAMDNPQLGALLDVISEAEGTSGPNGYNASFGDGDGSRGVVFADMSIAEVHEWQKTIPGSSATGRYQVMYDTLPDVVNGMGISWDENFTPEFQDRAAVYLMERAGLQSYLDGEIDTNRMMHNMAGVWAGLPTASGDGRYEGYGLNKDVKYSPQRVRVALEELRDSYQNPAPALIAEGKDAPEAQETADADGIIDPKDANFVASADGRSAKEIKPGFDTASADVPAETENTPTPEGPKAPAPAPAVTTHAPV